MGQTMRGTGPGRESPRGGTTMGPRQLVFNAPKNAGYVPTAAIASILNVLLDLILFPARYWIARLRLKEIVAGLAFEARRFSCRC